MTRYAIGDIQGCFKEFITLIEKIEFNPSRDMLYLVGDLVNRGPDSLKILQWVYKYQDSIKTVLGNHDIYALGRYYQIIKSESLDTIQELLNHHKIDLYMAYLRSCPLVFHDNDFIIVHAGIHPQIEFNTLLKINNLITEELKTSNSRNFIKSIYNNKSKNWQKCDNLISQMRFIINSSTRMRFLDKTTQILDFEYKGEIINRPANLIPWFMSESNFKFHQKIIFGHWAALGFLQQKKFIAIDTGCVWGGSLTAINLETLELHQVLSTVNNN